MKCGSNDLYASQEGPGIVEYRPPLECSRYICRDCGYLGVPLIFDSDESRLKYAELQKKRRVFEVNGKYQNPHEKDVSSPIITTNSEFPLELIFWLGVVTLILLFLLGYIQINLNS
jgi:hypothetical protein